MTPVQILALIRDAVIVGGILWLLYMVYHAGENADIKSELAALQQQLSNNSKLQSQWEQERIDAQAKESQDISSVSAAIAKQRTPVILQNCPRGSTVPSGPAAPSGSTPGTGGGTEAPGRDIRSAINDYEQWAESNFAACRAILSSWPH